MQKKILYSISCLLLFSLSIPAKAEWFSRETDRMGTIARVEIWHTDEKKAEELIKQVFAEMLRIEEKMSPYITSSLLSKVNREAASKEVLIDDEFFILIKESLKYSEMTFGAFDITFASVGHLYDYRSEKKPDSKTFKNKLSAINYKSIVLDKTNNTIRFLNSDTKIDLGGIAKGYAVDRSILLLKNAGVTSAVVSAGGDSRLLGDRLGRPWYVGIKNPRGTNNLMKVPLVDVAISTSGDYERFFEANGERYHHILNPGTGKSVKNIQSVSVIADQAIVSDALSTSVFVLGKEKGIQLIESLPDVSAIIIQNKDNISYSSDLVQPDN